MSKNLIELIKASGYAGSNGQSFRSNVTSAGNGVGVASYLLGTGGSATGGPPVNGEANYVASGTSYNIVIPFTGYGNYFQYIRNGTGSWGNYGSSLSNCVINSVTWSETYGTATVNVTLYGEYDSNTLQSLYTWTRWFDGYSYPSQPGDQSAYAVTIAPVVTGSGTASGYTTPTMYFIYDPDSAAFNPNYTSQTWTYDIYKQAYPSWTTMYEWEAHDSSSYNNAVSATFYSYPGDNYTWYLRYRVKSAFNGGTAGSWTNYGAFGWSDPRFAQ